jgi:hypothetical protein
VWWWWLLIGIQHHFVWGHDSVVVFRSLHGHICCKRSFFNLFLVRTLILWNSPVIYLLRFGLFLCC